MSYDMAWVVITYILFIIAKGSTECIERDFGFSSFVCVCNGSQCHFSELLEKPLDADEVRIVKSSKSHYRNTENIFQLKHFNKDGEDADITITLDYSQPLQSIFGFGGAFTDATGINMRSLSVDAQDNIMKAYFSDEGSAYNLCRVPIAGTDFSPRPYSYDDHEGDVQLDHFALTDEDHKYKLPYIERAINLTTKELKLIGTPWSSPAWMKTNGKFNESGIVKKELWDSWSRYFVKFVEAYEQELKLKIWGLTSQNEPLSGLDSNWHFNSLGWTSTDMRDWIKSSLGPILEKAGLRRIIMMVDDYNRFTLPQYPAPMIQDPESSKYIDGIAVHWYDDQVIGPEVLDETHEAYPGKFILYTEACAGYAEVKGKNVALGSWERGESYIKDIIEAINHWSTGWVDWNMVLNMEGGPAWDDILADSPIIVNATADEFYLQPTYFALNLFSRNVQPGAQRISFNRTDHENIHLTAFKNPDDSIVVILANVGDDSVKLEIQHKQNFSFVKDLEARTWEAIHFNS